MGWPHERFTAAAMERAHRQRQHDRRESVLSAADQGAELLAETKPTNVTRIEKERVNAG